MLSCSFSLPLSDLPYLPWLSSVGESLVTKLKMLFKLKMSTFLILAKLFGSGDSGSSYGSSNSGSGYGAPSSGYNAPSSGYGAPSGGNNAPSSGYGAPSSGYNAPSGGGGGGGGGGALPGNNDFEKKTAPQPKSQS